MTILSNSNGTLSSIDPSSATSLLKRKPPSATITPPGEQRQTDSQKNMSAEDIVQVQQLVCREREGRDRQWWDEMRQAYDPEAFINISWYQGKPEGFIEGSKLMYERGAVAAHRLRPITVRVKGDRALATLSAAIECRILLNGVEADLDSQAKLIYKAVRRTSGEGGAAAANWKLFSLDAIYQRDTLTPAIPGEQLSLDMKKLKGYRSSYRCLSYVLEKHGNPVDQNQVGEDRAEDVKRVYDEAFSWLNST